MAAPAQHALIASSIRLPYPVRPVLAMGAWFKNTLCLAQGEIGLVSQTVGDLDNAEACRAHEQTARTMLGWISEKPLAIAHDLHPDFYSSQCGAMLAEELDVPLLAVQHHHAHIAAVALEHGFEQPLLGLALDGVGLGSDGSAWGGELLQLDGARCERLGHLRQLPLPGGDRAAREPWRMAAAALHECGRGDQIPARFTDQSAAATVASMLQRGLNSPPTSSAGRLFDAAAGLLGLCAKMEFEAQAAIALEQAATRHVASHGLPQPLPAGWQVDGDNRLDLRPLLLVLAETADAGAGAALFHATLVAALADWVEQAAHRTGITTLACGGGCFLNRLLTTGLCQALQVRGITLLTAQALPPGDSAIALGQAWVAQQTLRGD
jgi:hydrogenase maturation protein HypF